MRNHGAKMDTTATDSACTTDASATERVIGLVRAIEETCAWALAPLADADRVARELVALADRRNLPPAALRMLAQSALGEPVRPAVVDRWLEEDPEVLELLGRVREVARQLEGASTRARAASRRAMELALSAPLLVKQASREIWQRGPSPGRDAALRRLEVAPTQIKARTETIRAELASLQVRAEGAKKRMLEGLRLRARTSLARTDRLAAV